ncbi:MAG: hypothetical protein JSW11_07940 [Candidatus Heimdallarchaeota archaeon]|nr:MAG: hypothetical protein JSW11_07940 [Candidatus Heimdallarchaeota archaeon]
MMVPYYIQQIGLLDLFLISAVEIAFIWFFFPKEFIGKVFSMVGAVNLIKLGAMTLIFPSIPSMTENLYQMLLVEVTIVFILGIIISTLIYEKEQWAVTRESAGALAFRITGISSLIWVTYKSLQPYQSFPPYLVSSNSLLETSVTKISPIPDILPSFAIFGLLILSLGFLILFIRYKSNYFSNT